MENSNETENTEVANDATTTPPVEVKVGEITREIFQQYLYVKRGIEQLIEKENDSKRATESSSFYSRLVELYKEGEWTIVLDDIEAVADTVQGYYQEALDIVETWSNSKDISDWEEAGTDDDTMEGLMSQIDEFRGDVTTLQDKQRELRELDETNDVQKRIMSLTDELDTQESALDTLYDEVSSVQRALRELYDAGNSAQEALDEVSGMSITEL